MHLLLDIDGVLQFERPNLDQHMVDTLGWKGSHRAFREVLFADVQYHEALRGKCDFVGVLKRLLLEHQQSLDADSYLESWLSDFRLNHDLLGRLGSLRCSSISLASNQER